MISRLLVLTTVLVGCAFCGAPSAFAETASLKSPSFEFACVGREGSDRLPNVVRLQSVSEDRVDLNASYRIPRLIPQVSVKRIDVANQPKVAVFPIGGVVGISGDAKLLVSKDALKFNEIGTVMVVNQTTRESVVYQCQKVATTNVAPVPLAAAKTSATTIAVK